MKDEVFTSGLLSTESAAEAFANTEPSFVDSFRWVTIKTLGKKKGQNRKILFFFPLNCPFPLFCLQVFQPWPKDTAFEGASLWRKELPSHPSAYIYTDIPKYAKSFPSLDSGAWPGDFMIKTRLDLPNSEARKINCSYTYSAQEGGTETHMHTPASAASRKTFPRGTTLHGFNYPFSLFGGAFFFTDLILSCH